MRRSKARRVIEKWVNKTGVRNPTWIGQGQIFLYPGSAGEIYIVCWIESYTSSGNKRPDEFLCGCKGWKYSPTDECYHIKNLRGQLAEGKAQVGG